MTKRELLEKFDQVKSRIGVWDIELDSLTKAGFVLGCYYDQEENKWKIYETDERGLEGVYYRVDSEEDAYEKLYDLIMFHHKLSTGYFLSKDHSDC